MGEPATGDPPGERDPASNGHEHSLGVVSSEFAQVRVSVDRAANGPRLRLEDLKSGRSRFLDALELETLVWVAEESLSRLLDPGLRWREQP